MVVSKLVQFSKLATCVLENEVVLYAVCKQLSSLSLKDFADIHPSLRQHPLIQKLQHFNRFHNNRTQTTDPITLFDAVFKTIIAPTQWQIFNKGCIEVFNDSTLFVCTDRHTNAGIMFEPIDVVSGKVTVFEIEVVKCRTGNMGIGLVDSTFPVMEQFVGYTNLLGNGNITIGWSSSGIINFGERLSVSTNKTTFIKPRKLFDTNIEYSEFDLCGMLVCGKDDWIKVAFYLNGKLHHKFWFVRDKKTNYHPYVSLHHVNNSFCTRTRTFSIGVEDVLQFATEGINSDYYEAKQLKNVLHNTHVEILTPSAPQKDVVIRSDEVMEEEDSPFQRRSLWFY